MHELAITESIRDIALRHAAEAGAVRITDIRLVIGQLSSVVDESIQFYWDIISEGTTAEGGKLHFQRVPARLVCKVCEEAYSLNGRELIPCPACGGSGDIQCTVCSSSGNLGCPACGGNGWKLTSCPHCGGDGTR